MRIAMLVRRFDPEGGGTERDFAAAADCLSGAGHEVRIYAARGSAASWHGIPVRRLPVPLLARSLEVLSFGLLAPRLARREGAELTLSFGLTADTDLIRCEGGAHSAYLEAARQWESWAASAARALSPYHAAQCRMEARGFRSARLRRVLAISRLVGDDVGRRFALPLAKIEVLYNGVDHERFKNSSPRLPAAEIRRRFNIDRSSPLVLFIGNGFGRKGLGQLIEALAMSDGKAWLVVAGEDRAAGAYQKMARRLRVERRVLFLGKRNDIADLLAAADVVALPSLFEAFGNVVLEGMAAGRPVLTSARCGAAEVLPAQLQPFVVQDPMNPAEIAQRLQALMAAPRELGAIARAAAAQFTWERYGARLVELIEGSRRPSG
ncbi:MAG TPA: glycosyltransferase family 4 protein [Candidatus Binataceae bacterium]